MKTLRLSCLLMTILLCSCKNEDEAVQVSLIEKTREEVRATSGQVRTSEISEYLRQIEEAALRISQRRKLEIQSSNHTFLAELPQFDARLVGTFDKEYALDEAVIGRINESNRSLDPGLSAMLYNPQRFLGRSNISVASHFFTEGLGGGRNVELVASMFDIAAWIPPSFFRKPSAGNEYAVIVDNLNYVAEITFVDTGSTYQLIGAICYYR